MTDTTVLDDDAKLGLYEGLDGAGWTPAFDVPASMWLDEEQALEAFPDRGGCAVGCPP